VLVRADSVRPLADARLDARKRVLSPAQARNGRVGLAGVRVAGARLLAGASEVLLVLTGAYVVAYWLALGPSGPNVCESPYGNDCFWAIRIHSGRL
jgi:hypothetical protein